MKFSKEMLLLYAVTERRWANKQTLYEQIEQALKGGVTMLQLREKNLCEEEFVKEALKVKELCHRYNVPLIINDNLDVALKSGADGIHVGIEDMPVIEIRRNVPKNFIIGATAKTVNQARLAQDSGADYLGVGAIFPSPTKKNAVRITVSQLKEICSSVAVPVVAIGGICLENMDELCKCGISGIAVVSSVFASSDIKQASIQLKGRAKTILSQQFTG